MKNRTTSAGMCISPWLSFCTALVLASAATAQNQQRYYPQQPGGYAQPQYSQPAPNYQQPPPGYGAPAYGHPQQPQKQYENPIEFLPKFGKRMSEVVRRIFYGQNPTGWDNPPPAYGPNGGYSLESTPRQQQTAPSYPQPGSGYQPQPPQQPGYQYPQQQGQAQPRYSYPPQSNQPTARSQQPAPQLKAPAPAPNTRTYSPPKVSQTPPKTTPKPATKPQTLPPAPKPPEPAPPPVTTRRSETTPREQFPDTTASNSSSFLKGRKTA
ncbi:MAG: hypothetical protein Q8M07_17635, partial [Prosthecobacter sp.]|nr:hypothetical protein [Prosthecobacter sp.]